MQDAKAEASRRAANVGRPPKMKMPRKDHRSAKQRKRAAKEEKERLRSINELIKTEEHRLLEHKKVRKSEALKREILEHATSLEFELQQLIIFLRRTPRQKMLMREAQADQEVRMAQLENLSSAVSTPASAAAVTVVPASQGNPRSFSRSELDTKLRRLSSGVILSQLILQDLNGWFFRPVSDLVPNYAKAISPALPSDFGTVWCRLVQKGYDDHPDQFAEDLRKIWQNCQLYNGKKAQVTLEAMRLASIFETNWAWLRGYSEETPRAPPESDAVTYMDQENVGSVKNDAVHLSSESAPSSSPSSSAGISPPSPVSSTGANTNIVATPQKVSSNEEPHGVKSSDSEGVQAVSGGSAPVPKVGKSSPEKLWCQCDHCEKWHVVPPSIDLDSLPDQWYCSMNTWNPKDARCDFKKSMHQNLGGTAAVASPNEPQVQFGLKKSLGLGLAEEPFVLLGRGEWLAYAREIGRFASVSKKLTLPKRFLKGIEKLYVKVGGELAGRRG